MKLWLCAIGLHSWRDVGPPQVTIDHAIREGGFALLGLVMLGGIFEQCERCGLENDALRESGGMAARATGRKGDA
jgi:hypothetical protein